mmetsp:Transcript_112161/g.362232  ORF Transcript_112161/g.362232 Transcript_112161/m.362232 type:complete len:209 (-) Transcript_112161:60-686(-)
MFLRLLQAHELDPLLHSGWHQRPNCLLQIRRHPGHVDDDDLEHHTRKVVFLTPGPFHQRGRVQVCHAEAHPVEVANLYRGPGAPGHVVDGMQHRDHLLVPELAVGEQLVLHACVQDGPPVQIRTYDPVVSGHRKAPLREERVVLRAPIQCMLEPGNTGHDAAGVLAQKPPAQGPPLAFCAGAAEPTERHPGQEQIHELAHAPVRGNHG